MNFSSDNAAPVPPQVMEAVARANEGYEKSYGADTLMDDVRAGIRAMFEAPEAEVYLVATGTAANALSLATFCPPWASVYCHRHAHIAEDECGAPEFYTAGAKLTLLDGEAGKIAPETLARVLAEAAAVGVHNVQRGMISLTNITEAGTLYTAAETAALCKIAKDYGLPCHLDGARFANAVAAGNASPAELTWKAGIDVLSFGGTKNGLLGVEAVVIFDPAKAWEFELRRKRGGHLFSKHRYLSAQMAAYLEDGLWLDLARRANAAGQRLANGLSAGGKVALEAAPPANLMFARLPRAINRRAMEAGASYYIFDPDDALDGPDDTLQRVRLVTSWCTSDEAIDRFVDLVTG